MRDLQRDPLGRDRTVRKRDGSVVGTDAEREFLENPFDPAVLCGRNLTLLGVGGEDARAYEPTLRLLARHHESLPLARAITHRFPLSQAAEAMETALRGDGAMKVVIEPQRRE